MLRVAIIGLGHRVSGMFECLVRESLDVRLVAVADPDRPRVRQTLLGRLKIDPDQVNIYESADDLLRHASEFDGVMIGTRCHLHAPLAVKVAATGLPLFLEKPVAITQEQMLSLREAFRGREDRVVVSFPLRRTPLFRAVLEIIHSGRTEVINQVQAINNVPYGGVYFGGWYRNYDQVGGLWLQKATHDFDYINLLVSARPTLVAATTTQRIYGGDKPHGLRCSACAETEICPESPRNLARRGNDGGMMGLEPTKDDHWCAFSREIRNEDAGSALVVYENGLHASYSQNFVSRRSAGRRGAIITGYRATVEFDWMTDRIRVTDHLEDRVDETVVKSSSGHSGGDAELARDFIGVMSGTPVTTSNLEDGLLSVAMCLAARRSSETKQFEPVSMSHSALGTSQISGQLTRP